MPAPRKPLDRDVRAPIAAPLLKVVERAGLTNKEVVDRARVWVPTSTSALSRYLRGQSGEPTPSALVDAVVRVAAAQLGIEPDALYEDYPALRDHVRAAMSSSAQDTTPEIPDSSSASLLETGDDATASSRAGWLWSLIVEDEVDVAVAALGGFPHRQEVFGLLAARDPGAAAVLIRAMTVSSAAGAALLLDGLQPSQSAVVTAAQAALDPVGHIRRRDKEYRDLITTTSGYELMGHRLAALMSQNQHRQACREIISLADHTDSGVAATVLKGLLRAAGREATASLLNSLGDMRADVLHEIIADHLETFPDSARPKRKNNLIADLSTPTVVRMIAAFVDPHWRASRNNVNAVLHKAMAAATVRQLVPALLPFAGQPEAVLLFDALPDHSPDPNPVVQAMYRTDHDATKEFLAAADTTRHPWGRRRA